MSSTPLSNEHLNIQKNGWKQLSILNNQDGFLPKEIPKGMYILVSQDCDIVQPCFKKESKVEIIQITEKLKPNKSLTKLKNFRTPQIQFKDNGILKYYEIDINNRYFIPRILLSELSPLAGIVFDEIQKKCIIEIMFARYERIALPDTFNAKFPKSEIKDLLEAYKDDIYGLFFQIEPTEENQPVYNLKIIMLVASYENFDDLLERIVEEIEKEGGIKVAFYHPKTMDQMTVRDYFEYQLYWHLTELSFQDENVGPLV